MFSSKLLRYLAISVGALIFIAIVGKKAGWFGNVKPLLVATEKVQKRTIYEIITANGKIQPETEVKVSSDVSGEIVELLVKEGEPVKQGQLLLKVKPDTYISIRDRATATLNTTKANYDNALARVNQSEAQFRKLKLAHERNKQLWEKKTISKAEWDASEAEFEMAKADLDATNQTLKSSEYNIKSAEASLKEAQENLYKTSIYAPIDGIITKLNVEKGERVVGTEMMSGTELLRVADLSRMEVKVDVNENDIVRVNLADTAIVEVDAYLDQKFRGIVTEIGNSANSSSQVTTDQVTSFEVKIIMLDNSYKHLVTDEKKYPFRPGMTANVDIQTQKKTGVLSVPIEAVTSRADSTIFNLSSKRKINEKTSKDLLNKPSEVVFLIKKALAKAVKVKTGIQDNNYIEIVDGLKDGDEVIVSPYSAISRKLKDSTLVKIVNKKDLFSEK